MFVIKNIKHNDRTINLNSEGNTSNGFRTSAFNKKYGYIKKLKSNKNVNFFCFFFDFGTIFYFDNFNV